MAILATAVWEVRPTNGDNTNGGGYDSGIASAGTDYSQQNGSQLSLTDLATSGAGSTTLTSATGGFTAAMIGNAIRINSGTNFTVGFYFITGHTDTNTVTLDRTPTAAGAGSGGAGKVGGATASVSSQTTTTLSSSLIAGNKIWIKNEAWNEAVSLSVSGNSAALIVLEGYNSARGDAPTGSDRPRNNRASAAGNAVAITAAGNFLKHLWISNAGSIGVSTNNGFNFFLNVRASNNGSNGFSVNGSILFNCQIDNNTTSGFSASVNAAHIIGCTLNNNGANGFVGSTIGVLSMVNCILYANSGHGFSISSGRIIMMNCTLDGNTGASSNGISSSSAPLLGSIVLNTILSNNGNYGALLTTAGASNGMHADFNNFFGNATGARSNFPTGANDQTADPQYANSGSGDFSIGTNLKALGFPGVFPGSTTTGYLDIGAAQRLEQAVNKLVGMGGLAA